MLRGLDWTDTILDVVMLDDGRVVASTSAGYVNVWDLDRPGEPADILHYPAPRDIYPIEAIALLADGRLVVPIELRQDRSDPLGPLLHFLETPPSE